MYYILGIQVMKHFNRVKNDISNLQVIQGRGWEEHYKALWYKEMVGEKSLQEDDDGYQGGGHIVQELEKVLVKTRNHKVLDVMV